MKRNELMLALQSAFLGAIRKNFRAIAFDYTEDSIAIYAYLDVEPSGKDYEVIDIAISELMAIIPKIRNQDIHIVKDLSPIGKLNYYKGWFFVRCEE